jgi:hypothetical protein
MSALCQKRTSGSLFDHLVGAGEPLGSAISSVLRNANDMSYVTPQTEFPRYTHVVEP